MIIIHLHLNDILVLNCQYIEYIYIYIYCNIAKNIKNLSLTLRGLNIFKAFEGYVYSAPYVIQICHLCADKRASQVTSNGLFASL